MIAWLFAVAVGSAGALAAEGAVGAPRELAAAEVPATCFAGEAAVGPHVSVTVRADGTVEYDGHTFDTGPPDALWLPALVEALAPQGARNVRPAVLLDADPNVGFERMRRVLNSLVEADLPEVRFVVAPRGSEGVCTLHLTDRPLRTWRSLAEAGRADGEGRWVPSYLLVVHLVAHHVWVGRQRPGERWSADGVFVWDEDGERAWETLRAIFVDEARAGGTAITLVVLNTDDGVPAGDTLALYAMSREAGFGEALFAGGPAFPWPVAPRPPEASGAVEAPALVEVTGAGDVLVTWVGGGVETILLADVAGFEERCDGASCGLVLRTKSGRGVAFGARRAGGARFVLSRPVYRYDGAPAAAQPTRTGTLTVLAPRGR